MGEEKMKKIKVMKKSMFFTTVLMVVLLIVALSTATFAWFSANNTVTATQTTMTAAKATSANIAIGWAANPTGSTISFQNVEMMNPAIPNALPLKAKIATDAMYVATNNNTPGGTTYKFVGGTYGGAPSVQIVDINLGETIKTDATDNVISALVGGGAHTGETAIIDDSNIASFARIYKTQNYEDAKYIATSGTLNTGEFTQINLSDTRYDFLTISTSETGGGFITPDAAQAVPYSIPSNEAVDGNRIYHRNALKDTYRVYAKGTEPNAGQFIASGVSVSGIVGKDYLTFLSAAGTLDTHVGDTYYINKDTARGAPYKCVSAKAGDTMFCTQQEKTEAESAERTTVGVFTGSLQTSSIDTESRFRSNGSTAGYSALKQASGGTATNFYIKNTGALGSSDATITLKASIEGVDGATTDDVRIAVFMKTAADSGYYYVNTLGSGENDTCYGQIIAGAYSTKDNLGSYKSAASLDGFTKIAAQAQIEMQFVVWYEGTMLGTAQGGKSVNVSFTFSAA